jgi:uncharacterized membrane protein YfcA
VLGFWIGFVGIVMGLLGALVSLFPPKDKQIKIVSTTAFIVSSVLLVALLWIKATDDVNEKEATAASALESRAILLQTQKEFRDFRGEVVEAAKQAE